MIQISACRISLLTVGLAALIVGTLAACARTDITSMPGAMASVPVTAPSDGASADPTPSLPPTPTTAASSLRPGAFAGVVAYLRDHGTHTAVAAEDLTSGATLLYNSSVGFHTASIVKVDILATLLLQHQREHTGISGSENALAVRMITQSDNDAANSLWDVVGGSAGVREANKTFHLTGTQPGNGGDWGSTVTTAADQLALLKVLASSSSPLSASSRAYELGLMSRVESDQRWGVPAAAATDAAKVYNKNGWYPFSSDGGTWTMNSLGEIVEGGHTYLVAVLSNGNATEGGGETLVGNAATIALSGLTGN